MEKWLLYRLFFVTYPIKYQCCPHRNQSIDLLCKSIDWFLYEGNTGIWWVNQITPRLATSDRKGYETLEKVFLGRQDRGKFMIFFKKYINKTFKPLLLKRYFPSLKPPQLSTSVDIVLCLEIFNCKFRLQTKFVLYKPSWTQENKFIIEEVNFESSFYTQLFSLWSIWFYIILLYHSQKKWKDNLEDSLDRILFAAEL